MAGTFITFSVVGIRANEKESASFWETLLFSLSSKFILGVSQTIDIFYAYPFIAKMKKVERMFSVYKIE